MKALLLDLVGDELASLCDLTAIFSSLYDAGSDSNHQTPGKTEIWSVNRKYHNHEEFLSITVKWNVRSIKHRLPQWEVDSS